jgi:hypothetical protein
LPSDLAGRGGTLGVRFGLAHFSNGLWFFDDFSKLTWHLGHVLIDSFSLLKAGSFDVTQDFRRWLFIVGQQKIASAAQVLLTLVANLPLVSLIPAAICDTGGAPWLANISANFRKNSKWT